ncbi:MAG: GNAT family N-acetyltransferase [Candidatus Methanofastidiosia archaeon]|jgi:hypothetical protein
MNVRQMNPGDRDQLPDVFNTMYADYSLYHVRTPQFYQYLLIQRPGVGEEHIYVAEEGDEVVGYAAVGIQDVEESTRLVLYEMVAFSKGVFNALMSKIEEIGREKKCAYIETTVPPDSDLALYFLGSNFLKAREFATLGKIVDFKKVISLFVERALSISPFEKCITIAFYLGKERVSLELPEGIVGNKEKTDIQICVSPVDFLSLLLKKSSFFSLLVRRRIKITPFRNIISAYKIVTYISCNVEMITPITELALVR